MRPTLEIVVVGANTLLRCVAVHLLPNTRMDPVDAHDDVTLVSRSIFGVNLYRSVEVSNSGNSLVGQ